MKKAQNKNSASLCKARILYHFVNFYYVRIFLSIHSPLILILILTGSASSCISKQSICGVISSRTNPILAAQQVYPDVASPSKKALKSLLEKDIREDTSGDFKRICIAAAVGNRYEITRERLEQAVEEVVVNGKPTGTFDINYQKLVDQEKVKQDAQRLYKAGEDRWGTDEEEFNIIFSTRDYYHLREVWNEYVKVRDERLRKI